MPQFGSGIIPQQGAIASELAAITRRAFLPKVYIQLWKSTPLMAALLSHAQVASGGLSPITVPLQGSPMVTIQNVGYDGSFNQPGVLPGLQNAEFNLKGYLTAIPFLGMEGLVQLDYAVVPLIEARMNDATNVTLDRFATDLFNNLSNNASMIGLPGAIDDGTNLVTYGGVSRTANIFWKSTFVNNAAPTNPTRNLLLQYIAQVTKVTGEIPKIGICGFGTWTALAQDFTSQERYVVTPTSAFGADNKVSALFRALDVAGVPVYADPYCPEGTLYLINSDYLSLYIHERAGFYFTGFESTLPNGQFGYIGALLTLLELVDVKCKAHGKFANLAFLNI
jgi:hypothetical protein